jgi:hypothetical protein
MYLKLEAKLIWFVNYIRKKRKKENLVAMWQREKNWGVLGDFDELGLDWSWGLKGKTLGEKGEKGKGGKEKD